MPHLDEGTIHAYLDGELLPVAADTQSGSEAAMQTRLDVERHMSECADCRAALEDARQTRQAAAEILASAGPGNVHMPSFAELKARAVREAADDMKFERRGLSNMRTLAWAATIVLAAAVGWYARSAVLSSRTGAAVTEEDAGGRLTFAVPQIPSLAQSSDTEAGADAAERAAATPEEEANAPIGGVEMAQPRPTALDEVQAPAEAEPRKGIPEPTVDIANVVRTDSGEMLAQPVGQIARRDRIEAPQARQAAVAEAAPAPMVSLVAGAGAGAAETWQAVDEAEAALILGRQVPTIEGIAVREYSTSLIGGLRAVRVQQVLDTGGIIDLIVLAGFVDEFAEEDKKRVVPSDVFAGEETSSVNTIVMVLEGLSIRISAALTTDSLRALSERLTVR